jgi:hypothetical protein
MDNAENTIIKFSQLYAQCGILPMEEVIDLMEAANEFVENPNCEIVTDSIMSAQTANAPCATDGTELCANSLSSGFFTCKDDYCVTCGQAHSCDHSCEIPCPSMASRPPAPPKAEICETDAAGFCEQATSTELYTCAGDFCLSCPQAHTCDKTCKLPCAGGGGHRRWLAENGNAESISLIVPSQKLNPPTCPLDLYMSRVEATTSACCPEASCPAGAQKLSCFMLSCASTLCICYGYDIMSAANGRRAPGGVQLRLWPGLHWVSP